MKWRSRSPDKFEGGSLKYYIAKVRGIGDVETFLNPPPSSVHSPLLLKNIHQAIERVVSAIDNSENISVFADP